jgi:hypothetical protein
MTKKSKKQSATGEEQPKSWAEDVKFTNNVVKKGLRNVASHHIESFNYTVQKCLPRICSYMLPIEVNGGSAAADAPSGR